jgi:hypothetical protein
LSPAALRAHDRSRSVVVSARIEVVIERGLAWHGWASQQAEFSH